MGQRLSHLSLRLPDWSEVASGATRITRSSRTIPRCLEAYLNSPSRWVRQVMLTDPGASPTMLPRFWLPKISGKGTHERSEWGGPA
jgi:hypothetical protein